MLANERRVSASTHHQVLSALLFLYRAVFKQALPWMDRIERPKRPRRLPVIRTVEESAGRARWFDTPQQQGAALARAHVLTVRAEVPARRRPSAPAARWSGSRARRG